MTNQASAGKLTLFSDSQIVATSQISDSVWRSNPLHVAEIGFFYSFLYIHLEGTEGIQIFTLNGCFVQLRPASLAVISLPGRNTKITAKGHFTICLFTARN